MSLEAYKEKRIFSKTPEPKGVVKKPGKKLIFVVHDHHASHHHYDLRLEMDGALASWAIPKEPPIEKGTKRLAVQVEDHPLSYATFKGTIPEGNYGAGKVEIWDNGTYELKFQDEKKIEFALHGKKLTGNFVLVKTSYGSKPEKSWLWFKV
ncbi:MAG: DNA polymerase ligase N-terminal domain-containing protein [Nanoarchaeota archaeon]